MEFCAAASRGATIFPAANQRARAIYSRGPPRPPSQHFPPAGGKAANQATPRCPGHAHRPSPRRRRGARPGRCPLPEAAAGHGGHLPPPAPPWLLAAAERPLLLLPRVTQPQLNCPHISPPQTALIPRITHSIYILSIPYSIYTVHHTTYTYSILIPMEIHLLVIPWKTQAKIDIQCLISLWIFIFLRIFCIQNPAAGVSLNPSTDLQKWWLDTPLLIVNRQITL